MAIDLLIIQPTPFCNIDCDYCYLPNRSDRSRMSMDTLAAVFRRVFTSGLVDAELSVVWHAGEPLVVPPHYYRDAFNTIEKYRPSGVRIRHSFQSNGILLDDEWCTFIRERDVNIGLSIDGPEWLHNAHRKTRNGHGTHAATLKGMDLLRRHGISFHAICLLTRESLGHPDAIFEFFSGTGITMLCFNIEEIEGMNTASSLDRDGVEGEFRTFFERILHRLRDCPSGMHIREVEEVLMALRHPEFGRLASNAQNEPLRIISVAHNGEFGTFSPELLGLTSERYGAFTFGDVGRNDFTDMSEDSRFRKVSKDIAEGVRACRDSCKYFDFCRGGAPANKLGETGTFASTETMFCRLTQKIVVECVLSALEADLAKGGSIDITTMR